MYLLINSFFPFVCWKRSLSREPHLIAGMHVSWKRGYHIFSSNDTHVFQVQGIRYPIFQGKPTFSPPIRVLKVLEHYWEGKVFSAPFWENIIMFVLPQSGSTEAPWWNIKVDAIKATSIDLVKIRIRTYQVVSMNNNNNNNHRYHKRLGASFKFPNGISTNCIMWCIGIVAHCSPVWIIPPLPLKSAL